jgi:hypothetical protein
MVFDGDLSNWDSGYVFALGNELTGDRGWLGSFDVVAIYSRALSAAEVEQNFAVGPAWCGDAGHPRPAADLDGDCQVGLGDLWIITSQWLNNGCVPEEWCSGADLDRSGNVDFYDFAEFASGW